MVGAAGDLVDDLAQALRGPPRCSPATWCTNSAPCRSARLIASAQVPAADLKLDYGACLRGCGGNRGVGRCSPCPAAALSSSAAAIAGGRARAPSRRAASRRWSPSSSLRQSNAGALDRGGDPRGVIRGELVAELACGSRSASVEPSGRRGRVDYQTLVTGASQRTTFKRRSVGIASFKPRRLMSLTSA